MHKSSKYNFVLIILLVIIGVFVGATPVLTSLNAALPPQQEAPTVPDDNEPVVSQPIGKFNPPSATASAFTRLAFGFKVLEEGEGFYAETVQEILTMGQKQSIFTKSYRAGKQNALEEWQFSNTDLAKNQLAVYYDDGANIKIKTTTNKSHYNPSTFDYKANFAGQVQTYSAQNFVKKFNHFNNFPLTVSPSTSQIRNYDKRSDANNYVITVTLNPSKVNQTYIEMFKHNGTENVVFSKVELIFKVNKKTGFFSSITKIENFSTTFASLPIVCNSVSTQKFYKVNTSMQNQINAIAQNF